MITLGGTTKRKQPKGSKIKPSQNIATSGTSTVPKKLRAAPSRGTRGKTSDLSPEPTISKVPKILSNRWEIRTFHSSPHEVARAIRLTATWESPFVVSRVSPHALD